MEEVIDSGNFGARGNEKLPNSVGVLVLGIISIVFAGLVGLICGIISLSMAGAATREYNQNSMRYSEASYSQMKAGKVCGIIGVCLSSLVLVIIVLVLIAAS